MARVRVDQFYKPGFVADTDAADLGPDAMSSVNNVRFALQGPESFAGESAVFGTPSITPLWIKPFPPPANPLWVYAGLTKVYCYDGVTHTDISRVSGGAYAGNTGERWQGEVFQGVGVFNNVLDNPQMWSDFSAATPLVALTAWPANFKCKALRSWKNFLFALHTKETSTWKPYRVRWSSSALPGTVPASWDISDATQDAGEVDIAGSPGQIVDGLHLGEQFIVYKEDAVHSFQYVGPPYIFSPDSLNIARGLLWRDCAVNFKGGHFVAGIDDIYIHSGQRGSDQSIVESLLRRWVFKQIDQTNYFNCFAFDYPQQNEVWFCFPEVGATYATLAFVWNKISGAVGIRELPGTPFAAVGPLLTSTATETWG